MSWLDQVAAWPLVGLRTKPHFLLATRAMELLTPHLDRWFDEDSGVEVKMGPGQVHVTLASGFDVRVSHNDIVVKLAPIESTDEPKRPDQRGTEGPIDDQATGGIAALAAPAAARVDPVRYSVSLAKTLNLTHELLDTFRRSPLSEGRIAIVRFGVVATCRIDSASPPPGVADLVESLRRAMPDDSRLVKSDTTLLARLLDREDRMEQCHHSVAFNEGEPAKEPRREMRFTLDWQRIHKTAVKLPDADKELEGVAKSATEYFELFGSGAL